MDDFIDHQAPLRQSIARLSALYAGKVCVFRRGTEEKREYKVTQADVDRAKRTIKNLQTQLDATNFAFRLLH